MYKAAVLALTTAVCVLASEPVSAQAAVEVFRTPTGWTIRRPGSTPGSYTGVDVPSVPVMLARLDRDYPDSYGPAAGIGAVLTHADRLPVAMIDSVLDGLQRLALTSPRREVRTHAVGLLATAGKHWPKARSARAGNRLAAIYRGTSDPDLKALLVGLSLSWLAEPGPALPILRDVAMQAESQEDFPEASVWAVESLARMGDPGRSVLRDLHRRGAVRSAAARYRLDALARTGFGEPPRP
jgi:hypothetical protein